MKKGFHSAKHKIMLVDDEQNIIEVMRRALELRGFNVDAFSSSQRALETFKPGSYDLAILDIRMPGLTGIQLFRELRKRDPKIIAAFLSAFEMHPDEFEKVFPSIGSEVKTIIKKPVTIDKLVAEITSLLTLSAIAKAAIGDHIFALFETPHEQLEQSLRFLKTGLLENDEDIMLVTDQLSKKEIREKIAKEWRVDVSSLEVEGRITLMGFNEWHLPDGKFDIGRNKACFAKIVDESSRRGRKGFRLVGDMNPFIKLGMSQKLLDLEAALGRRFNLPVISLCAYTKKSVLQLDSAVVKAMEGDYHNRVVK